MHEASRREVLRSTVAGILPLLLCGAAGRGRRFTPEEFGASGDRDDYDSFARLVAVVNAAGGGTIALRPGRTYFFNRHIVPGGKAADLVFADCNGLTITGNGARIRLKGDFHRDRASVRSLAGLTFSDCRNIVLTNFELAGGVDQTTRRPDLTEAPSHGLTFQGCSDVTIDGLTVRHFAADGLYIREGGRADGDGPRQASRRFQVRNSRFLFNARQGLSIIQLRGGLFENCEFSYTGVIDTAGKAGPYGAHSPGAGVDVEPNRTPASAQPVDVLTGDIVIRRCRLVGNAGAALVAAKYAGGTGYIERVTIESCLLECNDGAAAGQDGFIFDVAEGIVRNCTLRMRDKTAYLGWYPESHANPLFSGNSVTGRNPRRNRPMFAVRPTRGSPMVENSRFVGEQRREMDSRAAWLLFIDNANALVRNNEIVVPAAAFRGRPASGSVPIVFARARLMEGNRYETDLADSAARFGIVYAGRTQTHNEAYRGRIAGPKGTFRPVWRRAG